MSEKPLNILLLEDYDDGAEQIRQTLQQAGIEVEIEHMRWPKESLGQMKKRQYDCILVDYELPLGGGLRFIRQARESGIQTPIIVVNINEQEQIIMDMMKAGASDYLIHGLMTKESLTHIIRRSLEMVKVKEEIEKGKSSLRESEERFHAIIESAPYAIISFDADNKIIDWNPTAESIFGYTREEIVGHSLLEKIIPKKYRAQHVLEFKNFAKTGTNSIMKRVLELTACNKHREEFPIEIKFTVVQVEGQNMFIAFVRDITQAKTQEKTLQSRTNELIRSNQELENFAYVASHDLKEPLRMITSYTTLLERDIKDIISNSGKEYLAYISEGSARMKNLIDALLEYSRIGRDNNYLKVDFNELLQNVLRNLARYIKEKKAEVKVGQLPEIEADPAQIIRLFQNLIINALKFNDKERPSVAVKCEKMADNQSWQFSVSDDGIGIPEDSLDRIFKPFQRLHTHTEYDGTGIGLAACRKIIENHNGNIWAESKPGHGSTFYFSLPEKHE